MTRQRFSITFWLLLMLLADISLSMPILAQSPSTEPYLEARERLMREHMAAPTYIYGVVLKDDSAGRNPKPADTVSVLLSGIGSNGTENRQCTGRLWHIRRSSVLAADVEPNFKCGNLSVQRLTVDGNATVIEEVYAPFRLSDLPFAIGSSGSIVFLTVHECLKLGGKVELHDSCQTTGLKCSTGTKATCITEGVIKE